MTNSTINDLRKRVETGYTEYNATEEDLSDERETLPKPLKEAESVI